MFLFEEFIYEDLTGFLSIFGLKVDLMLTKLIAAKCLF